jgi:hypothetical protein
MACAWAIARARMTAAEGPVCYGFATPKTRHRSHALAVGCIAVRTGLTKLQGSDQVLASARPGYPFTRKVAAQVVRHSVSRGFDTKEA